MVDWPDTPLEISMLFNGVIIHCPDKDLVDELFSFLEENDIKWYGDEPVGETHWHENREETCYRIEPRGTMKYGSRKCYSDSAYRNYIKCTFYGVEPDFEISDAGFEAIIEELKAAGKKEAAPAAAVTAPPKEICTDQIPGIEVMDLEDAVQALWKEGIYAESGMGCTGPIVLMAADKKARAYEILKNAGYVS